MSITVKKIPSWIIPISLLVVFPIALFLLGRVGASIDDKIVESGIGSVATVVDASGQRIVRVSYVVNGKTYNQGKSKPFERIYEGEMFYMKYDESDPDSFVIFFNDPFFSSDFIYGETEGLTIEKTFSTISFKYKVNGVSFKRETLFINNQSLDPKDYIVKYRSTHPEIGYLIEKE